MRIRSGNSLRLGPVCCLGLIGLVLASCASLGETKIASSVGSPQRADLNGLEDRVAGLIDHPDPGTRKTIENDIRDMLAQPTYNKSFQAELWGLLAEIAILYNDRPYLQRTIAMMQSLNPSEPRLVVARSRLLSNPKERAAFIRKYLDSQVDKPDPRIEVEIAVDYYDLGQYRDAAAAFDEAFTALPGSWIALYQARRDKAYSLKDEDKAAGSQESRWLTQDSTSLESMLGLTLLRSPYLDRFGKESLGVLPALIARLKSENYLLPESSRPSDPQTRAEVAFFLFRIVADLENRPDLLTRDLKYAKSPVPDVPVDVPWFRAVLGLVQREILNLPDGTLFHPNDILATQEFLKALARLKTLYP